MKNALAISTLAVTTLFGWGGCRQGAQVGQDAGADAVDGGVTDGEAPAAPDGADGEDDGPDGGDCQCRLECGGRAWSCNSATGLADPLPVCSSSDPCRCLAEELRLECICEITTPSQAPGCRTGEVGLRRGRLDVSDAPALSRLDQDGTRRYACLFRPPDASAQNTYPLVVWLHGGGGGAADDLYDTTSLREKADPARAAAFALGGQGRPGFVLLAIHGRQLHYPTDEPRDGRHHDFYHRALGQPSTNRDISNLDAWIDSVVEQGGVDRKRIYLMGWSNGCFFSQLYAFARHELGTPAGNRPAAVACYSGADPFENINNNQQPSCKLNPYPSTQAPILLVGRNCDYPTCSQAQAEKFLADGEAVEPGHVVEPWAERCRAELAPGLLRLIIDGGGRTVSDCLPPEDCSMVKAVFNHIRWPDGKSSLDSVDVEPAMLEFLRDHPLP